MNQSNPRKITLRWIAIALSIILGVFHIILLGYIVQRQSAVSKIETNRLILEQNLAQMEQINQEQLDDKQGELAQLQEEVDQLRASFPDLGAPFALYHRALDLATETDVNLLSINMLSSDVLETESGSILTKQYSITGEGEPTQCIAFIKALEQAGHGTLTLDSVTIQTDQDQCSLELSTFGYPPTAE